MAAVGEVAHAVEQLLLDDVVEGGVGNRCVGIDIGLNRYVDDDHIGALCEHRVGCLGRVIEVLVEVAFAGAEQCACKDVGFGRIGEVAGGFADVVAGLSDVECRDAPDGYLCGLTIDVVVAIVVVEHREEVVGGVVGDDVASLVEVGVLVDDEAIDRRNFNGAVVVAGVAEEE